MASAIESIRTVFGAKNSFLKLMFVAALIAFPLNQAGINLATPLNESFLAGFSGWTSVWSIVTCCTLVFYFGFMLLSSHNLINEKEILIPGFFNPFKIFFVGLGGILAIGPMMALMGYVGYCLNLIFTQKQFSLALNITGVVITELILLGVLMSQMTLYTSKLNPLHSYNIVKVFKSFTEFIFKSILLLIVLTLFGGIVFFPLAYLSCMMFGQESFLAFYVTIFFITFLLAFAVNFYSQIAMESIVLNVVKIDYTDDAGSDMDRGLLVDNDKF